MHRYVYSFRLKVLAIGDIIMNGRIIKVACSESSKIIGKSLRCESKKRQLIKINV